MFHSRAALASGIILSSVCFGMHVGTPRSPVKCYADNRRHRDARLFLLRQLGDDEDQDGDDDDNAQRRQLIPTPAETAASLRAGPLWNCLKWENESESVNSHCWRRPSARGHFIRCILRFHTSSPLQNSSVFVHDCLLTQIALFYFIYWFLYGAEPQK